MSFDKEEDDKTSAKEELKNEVMFTIIYSTWGTLMIFLFVLL